MDYYRDSVTNQSWQFLQKLNQEINFVLIGGWAVWLYTRQLKSKDIDIVVDLPQLSKIRKNYEMYKNGRLKKYEIKINEVEVDIYPAYYSNLGIPAEEILANAGNIDGFSLPSPELLLILKSVAWYNRKISAKGRKDFLDIIGILNLPKLDQRKINYHWGKIIGGQKIVRALVEEISRTVKIPELNLNEYKTAKLKKKWLETILSLRDRHGRVLFSL